MNSEILLAWLILLAFGAYIVRAAVVRLGAMIEDSWEEWDDDGAAWPTSALSEFVKRKAEEAGQ